jgi:hypothetical protein
MKTLAVGLMLSVVAAAPCASAGLRKASFTKVADKLRQQLRNLHAHQGTDLFHVRALRNHDGSVDISFTTNPDFIDAMPLQWDPEYQPNIKLVALTVFNENGKFVRTELIQVGSQGAIYKRLNLKRHQLIEAVAIVDNLVTWSADGTTVVKRSTRVMSDKTAVNNRPDLQIVNVASPTTPAIGSPYHIDITIKEVGGDLPGDGLCYADMQVPLAPAYFGHTYPTLVAVDPGQTVICSLAASFEMSGAHDIKAEIVPRDHVEDRFLKEDYLTNNSRMVPVTVGPGVDVGFVGQGFTYGSASAAHTVNVAGASATYTLLASYAPYNYYYQVNGSYVQTTDNDTAWVRTSGVVAGRWLSYPLSVTYGEFGNDGVQVVNVTGTSSAPAESGSYYGAAWDPVTQYDYRYYFADYELDVLTDDATGTVITIQNQKSTDAATGTVTQLYADVSTLRSMGHQVFINTGAEAYRYDPNDPFTASDPSYSSIVISPTQVPASMYGNYRVALGVTDGAGRKYTEAATIPLPRLSSYANEQPYTCGGYSYTTDYGYHEERNGCSSSSNSGYADYGYATF